MKDLSLFIDQQLVDAQALTASLKQPQAREFLLASQLLHEHLQDAPSTCPVACDRIFAQLAAEPVMFAPALAKQNQAQLSLQLPAHLPSLSPIAASQSASSKAFTPSAANESVTNWKAWAVAASVACVAAVAGLTSQITGESAPNTVAKAPVVSPDQANAALQNYLRAHQEAQAPTSLAGSAGFNPYVQAVNQASTARVVH